MSIALLLLQVAPDIEIGARVRARSVAIERRGEASLTVRSAPAGDNIVDVRAPAASGRSTLSNVTVDLKVEARIAPPENNQETVGPK